MASNATTLAMPQMPKNPSTENLIRYYQDLENYQTLQNKQRETEIRGLYGDIIKRYSSGGAFQQEAERQLGVQKTQDIGRYTQDMINTGMFGTTQTAQLGSRWEAEVGAPSRLKLEDVMAQRISEAQGNMANFIERIQNQYPDSSMIGNLIASQANRGQGMAAAAGGGAPREVGNTPDQFSIYGNVGTTEGWGTPKTGLPMGTAASPITENISTPMTSLETGAPTTEGFGPRYGTELNTQGAPGVTGTAGTVGGIAAAGQPTYPTSERTGGTMTYAQWLLNDPSLKDPSSARYKNPKGVKSDNDQNRQLYMQYYKNQGGSTSSRYPTAQQITSSQPFGKF